MKYQKGDQVVLYALGIYCKVVGTRRDRNDVLLYCLVRRRKQADKPRLRDAIDFYAEEESIGPVLEE